MTTKEFKRVARILKSAYKAVESKARKQGMDLMSSEYEALIDKTRLLVLTEMGYSLDEYRKAKGRAGAGEIDEPKAKPSASKAMKAALSQLDKETAKRGIAKGSPQYEALRAQLEGTVMEEMDAEIVQKRSNLPFETEMRDIAEETARKIIPPPQTLKQIYQYDDSKLKAGLKELSDRVGKTVTQEELKARAEELKTEILTWNADNFSANFKKNIDVLGMPDFRKIAMGLQAQIDELETSGGSGDVSKVGTPADGQVGVWTGDGTIEGDAALTFDTTTNTLTTDAVVADLTGDVTGTASGNLVDVVDDTSPTLGGALDAGGFDINNGGVIFLTEQAEAEADVAGKGQIWVDTATPNVLMFTDDAGTDFAVANTTGTQTFTNKTLTSPKINEDVAVTSTATELNVLDGIPATLTATELGYVDGVTSAIQTQLDAKAPLASPTFTGTVTVPAATLNGQVNLDATPAADHTAVGPVTNIIAAGYTTAIGDLVFLGSGGKWLEVDADAVATCQGLMGIALEVKNDTEACLVALPGSFVRDDSWNWTVGATLYAGETLGLPQEAIPTGADAIIKVIGFAVTADIIYFNPSPDQQSTVA